MMRTLMLVGLAGGVTALSGPAQAQPAAPAAPPRVVTSPAPPQVAPRGQRWGSRIGGRWWAGVRAPGGWGGYRRLAPGTLLPSYWIQPGYYIADYGYYGLPAPAEGQGWSRYYDDAVLTDRYGRVIDARPGFDWDRYGGYDELPPPGPMALPPPRQAERDGSGNAVAGAVAGGIVGGIAGNAIAGRGDKTAGTLLGAGVGAVAGAAIGGSADRARDARPAPGAPYAPPPPPSPYPSHAGGYDAYYAGGARYADAPPPAGSRSRAEWKRSERARKDWEKDQRRRARMAQRHGYPDYVPYPGYYGPAYGYAAPMAGHWSAAGAPVYGYGEGYRYESWTSGGHVAGGWYYPGETVTTITIEPEVTTTTSYVAQARSAKRAVKRVHRPRKRVAPACTC